MSDDVMRTEEYTPAIGSQKTKGTQKILNMCFIVDTSGSMSGSRIGTVKYA